MKLSVPTKILIVDDCREHLVALETLLRDVEGIEVIPAESARQALDLLLVHDVHDVAVALLSVKMPGMDGFQLAERMRGAERTRHVPIIFVTTRMPDPYPVFEGYDAAAVDFFFQPIEARILKHKISTFAELHRQRQQITETLRLNDELMAVVGHDLRNPLGVILMTAASLAMKTDDPVMVKAAGRLQANGKRILRIIDDLFDLSRARLGGGIPVDLGPVSLLAVAKKTIAEIQIMHPEGKIDLSVEGPVDGEWDKSRIEQVFSSLLSNARHYGPKEEPVVVTLGGTAQQAVVTVQHGGVIAAELLPQIFEPFPSGRDRGKSSPGFGLGLYIVQQIVHSHGGSIEARSFLPQGTRFIVTLPRQGRAPEAGNESPRTGLQA